jgi:hypothetical protein
VLVLNFLNCDAIAPVRAENRSESTPENGPQKGGRFGISLLLPDIAVNLIRLSSPLVGAVLVHLENQGRYYVAIQIAAICSNEEVEGIYTNIYPATGLSRPVQCMS